MPILTSLKKRSRAAVRAFFYPALTINNAPSPIVYPPDIQLIQPGKLLQGKTLLVTGAGRNIGRAIALESAQQGAHIYFIDSNEDLCQQLEKELAEMGAVGKGFICDIRDQAGIDNLWQTLRNMQVSIDILVNNVGIHLPTSLHHLNLQEWQTTYQTNVFGPVYLTHLVSQHMAQQEIRGNILFISSIHQWLPVGSVGYSASKAAIGAIIEELAIELSPYSIRVNGIAPGWTALDASDLPQAHRRGQLHQTSIPPQYIGRAAVYLAADYFSQYTTGTVLKVDSGLSLMHCTVPVAVGGH
jgi:NAD(P)-dependent dehydrogenase (short-subunit alcohol dehydrogenase family)